MQIVIDGRKQNRCESVLVSLEKYVQIDESHKADRTKEEESINCAN